MSKRETTHSVTRKADIVTTLANPLSQIRYELGLILVALIPYWLVIDKLVSGEDRQLGYLFAYGAISATWLVLRIKRFVTQIEKHKAQDGQN
ncbi:MAG: hypothetical protein HUJ30_08980 [Gammaproteobacteria bacterium]|nr:hypothetical protein [Gammaproteobacteria bacterium]